MTNSAVDREISIFLNSSTKIIFESWKSFDGCFQSMPKYIFVKELWGLSWESHLRYKWFTNDQKYKRYVQTVTHCDCTATTQFRQPSCQETVTAELSIQKREVYADDVERIMHLPDIKITFIKQITPDLIKYLPESEDPAVVIARQELINTFMTARAQKFQIVKASSELL